MAIQLHLEVVTPTRIVLSESVDEVNVPGTVGQLGLLPGHTPLFTTLEAGELSYRQGKDTRYMAVNWGYLEIADDRVVVLVETAEAADQIDVARAEAALGRAEEELRKLTPEDREYLLVSHALQRALARIHVASHHGR
jgi:F-type H+-transporting ATPase subunit epsilon